MTSDIISKFYEDGEPEVAHVSVTEVNTDTQVAIAPWPDPAEGKIVALYVHISNPEALASKVVLYDKDLTVGTSADTRGSAAAPLLQFEIPANSNWSGQVPPEFFQAGICAQSTTDNAFISVFYVKV
jgi:hypothetical protein